MELKQKNNNKKGMYYTLDGILAGILVVGVIVILLGNTFYEPKIAHKSYTTQDIINSLSQLTLEEAHNDFIQQELANGNMTNNKTTVLKQIGNYWAENKTDKARQLFESVTNLDPELLSKTRISVEEDIIYGNSSMDSDNILSTPRMIAGISQGKPVEGYSSTAYLKKVNNKKTRSYAYYGGFTGQGNITKNLYLPIDYTETRMQYAELKIETPGNFEIYINNQKCGDTYYGTENVTSSWNITSCKNLFQPEKNKILLHYISDIKDNFISGGFLKAEYTTDKLLETENTNVERYEFAEVSGLVNIYDSISAQGLIENYTINMSFYSPYQTYLTLGNETIFVAPGDNETQNVYIHKTNQNLVPTEIPLRFGVTNLTNVTVVSDGNPADSMLVTDVSGSMSACAEYAEVNTTYCSYEYRLWIWWLNAECEYTGSCSSNECGGSTTTRDHQVYTQEETVCNRTRMEVAKDSNKQFVSTILSNSTLNEIGLVTYSTSAELEQGLINNEAQLHSSIDEYSASGGTCICCGINRARNAIETSEDNKFMVVISDGEPTYYCNSFNDYDGSGVWGGDGTGGSSSQTDKDWTINSAQEACQNNISVFAIGFGDSMSTEGHEVMEQVACNSSLYYNATSVDQLTEAFENITQTILLRANFSSQTLEVQGNYNITNISENSYIDMEYKPLSNITLQNKISLQLESDELNGCDANIDIPEGIQIIDAKLTSFSGINWNKQLSINEQEAYNITKYGSNYSILGDPFTIQIPNSLLIPGETNSISLKIGENPTNNSECSKNNTLIYTAMLNVSTGRTATLDDANGCNWEIESENNNINSIRIPSYYTGNKNCSYTSSAVNYQASDAYDYATYTLLRTLDPDNNKKILVDLTSEDLEIVANTLQGVPYLWGPSIIRVELFD